MAAWPASLPQQGNMNITIRRQNALARSSMDQGAPKVRKKFTAAIDEYEISMLLTGTQLLTFDTFFQTTQSEGATSFTWTSPKDDSAATFRFKEPPVWSLVSNSNIDSAATRMWRTTMLLEILP